MLLVSTVQVQFSGQAEHYGHFIAKMQPPLESTHACQQAEARGQGLGPAAMIPRLHGFGVLGGAGGPGVPRLSFAQPCLPNSPKPIAECGGDGASVQVAQEGLHRVNPVTVAGRAARLKDSHDRWSPRDILCRFRRGQGVRSHRPLSECAVSFHRIGCFIVTGYNEKYRNNRRRAYLLTFR